MTTTWPTIERPLADHLTRASTFPWTVEGGKLGVRRPLGVVQVNGGGHDLEQDATPDVEITLISATREGCWQMAAQVIRALAGLNPGGIIPDVGDPIHIDEVFTVFGFTIDADDSTASYRVARATFNLTLRQQDTTIGQP